MKKRLRTLAKKFTITMLSAITVFTSTSADLFQMGLVNAEENETSVATDNPIVVINELSTELYTGATEESTDEAGNKNYTWYAKTSDKGHDIAYRVNYSTSGEGKLDSGEFHFAIPMHVVKTKDGSDGDTYEMSLPTEDEFEEAHNEDDEIFLAYREEDSDGDGVNDQLYIYNPAPVSAALSGYVEINYKLNNTTFNYFDGTTLKDFSTELTAGEATKTSNICSAKIDTNASVTSASFDSTEQRRYTTWQSSWGDEAKPENAEDYYYTLWNIQIALPDDITQTYDMSLDSTFESTKGNVEAVAWRIGSGTFTASNQIVDGTTSKKVYATMITKYPKADYDGLTTMSITNNLTVTLTPQDGLKEATTATASRTFKWQQPHFTTPDANGTVSMYIHGNGTYEENEESGKSYWKDFSAEHAKSFDGKTGSYYENYELKEFQEEKTDSLSDITFYAHITNHYLAQTLKEDGDKTNPEDYLQSDVTTTYDSGELYLEELEDEDVLDIDYAFKSDALTSNDYRITSIDWKPYNKIYTFDEETQEFKTNNYVSEEPYILSVKTADSDEWQQVAKYIPSTGVYEILDENVVVNAVGNTVAFNKDANVYRYKIETVNKYGYTEIHSRTHLDLKNSETVTNYCKDKEVAYVFMKSYGSIDSSTTDYMAERYDFDRIVPLQKNSNLTKNVVGSKNESKKKQYVITWGVSLEETISSGSGNITKILQNGGTFYDLLPEGSTLDSDSLYVVDDNGDLLDEGEYTVETTTNFRNSGRILLTIKISKASKSYQLYYDTVHTWESIKDFGNSELNPVAYETGNEEISEGYYDDPTKPEDETQEWALQEGDRKWFAGLSDDDNSKARFVYTDGQKDILAITSASTGLTKKVFADGDASYSTSTITSIGSTYSYRLRYQNTYTSKTSNIILFDSLENYTLGNKDSEWRGTLQYIDVSQLTNKGAEAKIYYSTIEDLDLNANHDLSDGTVWTLADENTDLSIAKAIAVDATKNADGTDFVLEAGESISVFVYMKAPDESPEINDGTYPVTYNNVYMSSTFETSTITEDFFIHQDYTSVSLKVTGNVKLKKVNEQNEEQAIGGIKFRLTGTSDYGTSIDKILATNSNGEITFKDIEKGDYTLSEYDATEDYLLDYTPHAVTIDEKGRTIIDDLDSTESGITLTNKPRVHADAEFVKKVLGKTSIIKGAQFKLSGTSDYGNDVLMYASSADNGKVTFKNVEKGTYSLVEIKTPAGYVLNTNNKYVVKIDEEGQVSWSIETGDAETLEVNSNSVTVYNEEKHSVGIYKANSYDYSAVEGVTFELSGTSDAGTSFDLHATTGSSGIASFGGLESGTYILRETEVPEDSGVILDTTLRVLTIDKYGNKTIEGIEKDSVGNFIIVDTAKKAKQVTVIKKWKDSDGDNIDHSQQFPKIHIKATTSQETSAVSEEETNLLSKAGNVLASAFKLTTVNAEGASSDWYKDWDYEISGRYIWIKSYNGSETSYQIPSQAIIDGVSYTTLVGYWRNTAASLDTGTIKELSFENGVVASKYSHFLFYDNTTLTKVDLNGLDTSNTVNLYGMFSNCSNLSELDLGTIDTKNVTDMSEMFKGCWSLSKLDVSALDTRNVTTMRNMFNDCSELTELDLSNFNTTNVTDMYYMFNACRNITSLDLSSFNTQNVTTMAGMFRQCNSAATINVSSFNTSKVTDMNSMFTNCRLLKNAELGNFDTSKVRNMSYMFNGCTLLETLDTSSFDTSSVTDMQYMFSNCRLVTSLDLRGFNTQNVVRMNYMFNCMTSLKTLDLSKFDTAKVTNFSYMFNLSSSLTEIKMDGWDTSSATTMAYMFNGCKGLRQLDVSGFSTKNVTTFEYMFASCKNLITVDLSNFDTSSATTIERMFYDSLSLTTLNLSSFDTSKVTKMNDLLAGCSSLTTLELFENKATSKSDGNYAWYKSSDSSGVAWNNKTAYILTGKINAIKLKKGELFSDDSQKVFSNATSAGYTGNWTAFSEYNHTHGSKLEADVTVNGKSYVSLNASYASISDAEWAKNPDGIWFVYEKEGDSADQQEYVSTDNYFVPSYDENGNLVTTPEEQFPEDGYWQKIDDSTYSYTFYVYDDSVAWDVWEEEVDGYTGDATEENPIYIENGSKVATITNTKNEIVNQTYGNLNIESIVIDPRGVHVEKYFTYTLTLTDENDQPLSGTVVYDGVAFKDGVAKINISDNDDITIKNLPVGYHYTVVQDETPYEKTVTYQGEIGSIPDQDTAKAIIITEFPDKTVESSGRFIITNTVDGPDKDAYKDEEFNYIIDISGLEVGQTYSIYSDEDRALPYVTFKADKDGNANVSLVIKDGEMVYSQDIPVSATYTITQEGATDFITSFDASSINGTITSSHKANETANKSLGTDKETNEANEIARFDFLNVTALTKDLHLTKLVSGNLSDNETFEFTVIVKGLEAKKVLLTNNYGRLVADENGVATKTIDMKANDEFILKAVPTGATYTISETSNTKYTPSAILNGSEAELIKNNDGDYYLQSKIAKTANETESVVWTNTATDTYSVTYKKLVSGKFGNKSQDFEFEVQFDETSRANSMIIAHDSETDKDVAIEIDKDGVARFTLHHDQSLTFQGLTEDELLSMSGTTDISETEETSIGASEKDYSSQGYKTSFLTSYDDSSSTFLVTFSNTKEGAVPTGVGVSNAIYCLALLGLIGIISLAIRKKA